MSSNFSRHVPYASWDTATLSEMDPMIVVGFAKAQGLKAKPTEQVRAA
jgi:hypothetical protein